MHTPVDVSPSLSNHKHSSFLFSLLLSPSASIDSRSSNIRTSSARGRQQDFPLSFFFLLLFLLIMCEEKAKEKEKKKKKDVDEQYSSPLSRLVRLVIDSFFWPILNWTTDKVPSTDWQRCRMTKQMFTEKNHSSASSLYSLSLLVLRCLQAPDLLTLGIEKYTTGEFFSFFLVHRFQLH